MDEEAQIALFVNSFGESDVSRIAFAWNGKHADEFFDANNDFRTAVTKYVLQHPAEASVPLLCALFREHAALSVQAWGAPRNFEKLGALLLSRGGPDVVYDFASGFLACFDTYVICHLMSIDTLTLRHLSHYVSEELAGELTEERRRKLEAVQELFDKLKAGTAKDGWAVVKPDTRVSNIHIVSGVRLTWLRIRMAIKRTLHL
jgi:hypothetical protein